MCLIKVIKLINVHTDTIRVLVTAEPNTSNDESIKLVTIMKRYGLFSEINVGKYLFLISAL